MKKKILIVASNFYPNITKSLINYATKNLKNVKYNIVYVPGIFEIPVVISKNIKKYNGFIAIGCVIKGKTNHFELISNSTTAAIMNLTIQYKKPIGNGIISCFNKSQAVNRLDKGKDAAIAVTKILQM
tara:strand:- start:420 stop:803 length:384 start_codon:yes stop_codon:yes gene_type:complete